MSTRTQKHRFWDEIDEQNPPVAHDLYLARLRELTNDDMTDDEVARAMGVTYVRARDLRRGTAKARRTDMEALESAIARKKEEQAEGKE